MSIHVCIQGAEVGRGWQLLSDSKESLEPLEVLRVSELSTVGQSRRKETAWASFSNFPMESDLSLGLVLCKGDFKIMMQGQRVG